MKKLTPREWTIIIASLAILALVTIASSIRSIQFEPGHPYQLEQLTPDIVNENVDSDLMRTVMAVIRVMLIIGWLMLPLYVVYLVVSKEARRRLLRDIMMMLPILILLYLFSTNNASQQTMEEISGRFNTENLPTLEVTPAPPPPAFVEPPAWVTTLTSLVLAAVVVLVLIGIGVVIWKRTHQRPAEPLQKVEREAQAAIDAIGAGGDLRDVIIRCYLQMVEAIKEHRNIQRGYDMTPHEFELILEQRGLPREPVHQLTALFEQVRYGAVSPGRQDERTAIASLSAIVTACQRSRQQA